MCRLSKSKVAMVLAILGVVSSDGQCYDYSVFIRGCLDDSICCSWGNLNETVEVRDSKEGRIWKIEPTGKLLTISTKKDDDATWLKKDFFFEKRICIKKLIVNPKNRSYQITDIPKSKKLCTLLKGKEIHRANCTDRQLITHDKKNNVKFEEYFD